MSRLGRQAENGRPGGTRTPNMRFWRPPLYHSSYWPVHIPSVSRCLVHRFPLTVPVLRFPFTFQRGTGNSEPLLTCFLVRSVSAATITELLELQPLGCSLLVFGSRVIAAFALRAFKSNDISHDCSGYSRISEMVPAPTVRPPSRIANRNPFSIAIGVISLMVRLTLSPGITISVPSGNSATPVTSVVRK